MSLTVVFGKTVVASPSKAYTNLFLELHDGKIYKMTNFSRKPDITADVIMPGFIDPHVHCRDWSQSDKETMKTAGQAAVHGGVTRVHDMPNTGPPILTQDDATKRIEDAKKSGIAAEYGLYVGLTASPGQVRQAAEAVSKYPEVMGLKMYAGESTGSLAIEDPDDQMLVYKALVSAGYKGVLMVHCEKESMFRKGAWSVNNPETWCDMRPPQAETASVEDQMRMVTKSGFKGRLHICHASVPETVKMVAGAPSTLGAGCGVTPHHLLFSRDSMKSKSKGLYLKVNPPLRSEEDRRGMMRALFTKKIDWLETDHAPHTAGQKLNSPFASGVPGLDNYANAVTSLNTDYGIPFPDLAGLTSLNAASAFHLGDMTLKAGNRANLTLIDMKPETFQRKSVRSKCGWSPYEGREFPGRCKATIVGGNVAYMER